MDNTSYIALSRQLALEHRMTVVANNIANAATGGFKAERLSFDAVLEHAGEPGRVAFVQDLTPRRDLSAGPMRPTGNPLDLAVQGPGFFAIQTDEGVRHTRAGAFQLNDLGEVVNAGGHPLLDIDGAPILVSGTGGELTVADDGTLNQGETPLARIGVFDFAEPERLVHVGGGAFTSDEVPVPSISGRVQQGVLEGSNVEAVVEMTRMMETVRAFQSTQKFIETHHEMTRKAIERVLDVSG